jgi:signal transduction histidine kinase
MQPIDLRTLVEHTTPLEMRSAIQILPSPEVVIQGDPDQLQQVLINLLKNAAEATLQADAGDRNSSIQLNWSIAGRSVWLRIVDQGAGISNPENLFVPFYTTKEQGAGIGLTLSRQIVAAHGGTLQLSNRRDSSGCVAEVSLPISGSSILEESVPEAQEQI